MAYSTFCQTQNDQLKEPMFFGQSVNVARYDQQKHDIFERLIEKQLSFFWRPEEVDVSRDRIDYHALPAHEQHIFLSNLKYQTLLDSITTRSAQTWTVRKLLAQMSPADMPAAVRDALTALHNAGLKLAVGSSSKNAAYILERLDANRYFDAVCDGTMIAHSKPDPEDFTNAAAMVGLAPADCLVVEDAAAGLEAARAGGMDDVTICARGRGWSSLRRRVAVT